MNFAEIIDIITTSRNPLKIFSLLTNSYSLIAQELNNFSESISDKISENGYI